MQVRHGLHAVARPRAADTAVETLVPEPTPDDLDGIVRELSSTWKATITLRRQAKDDVGYREIYVYIDDRPAVVLRRRGACVSKPAILRGFPQGTRGFPEIGIPSWIP